MNTVYFIIGQNVPHIDNRGVHTVECEATGCFVTRG
jgi:hypothetical protein